MAGIVKDEALQPPAARAHDPSMSRRVVMVAFDGFQVLDLAGPAEVFSAANRLHDGGALYRAEVVTTAGGAVRSSCGIEVRADGPVGECRGAIDTLVVVGGEGTPQAVAEERLVHWVRGAARRSRRVTSVCTGAFVLAQAGLLAGRRATTHWSQCGNLGALFPDVSVEPDPIFVRDGDVWTSAGVTAGIDLALRLVEEDHGAELARAVARWLVLFVQRPGGQAQFSAQLAAQRPVTDPVRSLQLWMADHLDENLSVGALAHRCAMSPRHFARVFRAQAGTTPASYVEALRVEGARRLLETTGRAPAEISALCGFGTLETMHRAFRRVLGITPGEDRARFAGCISA
jgi:transcriptional regulator GlxA family with amidase domain